MSPTFIDEVRRLLRSNDHTDCERVLIETVYKATLEEVIQGGSAKRLGGGPNTPFIRRRMESHGKGKSSGYRLYLWAFKVENDIYLLYLHPKTGRRSATNISTEFQKELVVEFKKFKDNMKMVLTRLSNDGSRILIDDGRDTWIFK
jgi:hypothetical protein